MTKPKKPWHHVTASERKEIALYLAKGHSQADVARMLGHSPSTISAELKRMVKGVYDPEKANQKARVKRLYSKSQGMKVHGHAGLLAYVREKLKLDWSPEQIGGRIKRFEKHLPTVSTDAIYKFVKSTYGVGLVKCLRYRGKGYGHRTPKESGLTDRTFIEKRPKYIEQRRRFGHWEADFIVSGRSGSGALLVFVERKTRYVLIFKLKDRKVATINEVLGKLLGVQLHVKTLTIDNDVCFRHHPVMSQILGAPIFFCHPYHSWEKGSVENMNKWIRQYVKKGSDVSEYTDEYIQFVEDRLNGRPRKCLKFSTPREALARCRSQKCEIRSMIKVVRKEKTAA